MSRGAAWSSKASRANDANEQRDPPPSTLTAQLVQNHTDGNARSQPQKRATFCQLLEEIRTSPDTVEADVHGNHKLISVVSEAGLDALAREDPFTSTEETVTQAIACLDVIEIAFSRSRDVLFHGGQDSSSPGTPLALWLVPKLLILVGRKTDVQLAARVRSLLVSFQNGLAKDYDRWEDFLRLLRLLQCFADDALAAISGLVPFNTAAKHFQLLLPSSETRVTIYGDSQEPIALPRGSQVLISDILHAIILSDTLIGAIQSGLETVATMQVPSDPSILLLQRWAIKSLHRLWKGPLSKLAEDVINSPLNAELVSLFLGSCRQSARLSLRDSTCELSHHQLALLLTSCFDIPVNSLVALNDSVQQRLIENLELLHSVIQHQPSVLETIRSRLLTRLREFEANIPNTSRFRRAVISAMENLSSPSKGLTEDTAGNKMEINANGAYEDASTTEFDLSNRPKKRLRLHGDMNGAIRATESPYSLLAEFCSLLGGWDSDNLDGLAEAVESLFSDLSPAQKRRVLLLFADIPCASKAVIPSKNTSLLGEIPCQRCELGPGYQIELGESCWTEKHWTWFQEISTAFINSKEIYSSTDYRVLCLLVTQRLISHSPLTKYADLSGSPLGQFCLQSISSSHREVRLAAVHVLPFFLRMQQDILSEINKNNRMTALDFLRQLSDADASKFTETIILAFGQVGSICGDDELNLILLRLVEYLGHSNPLVCGLAHSELRRLAAELGLTIDDLFKPFWRTVAVTALKDLQIRPQKAQQLADLMGLSVNQLLIRTQSETIPYLVMWKNKSALQRIASATGTKSSVKDLCMTPSNRAAILSLLLAQNQPDPEATIAAAFEAVADGVTKDQVSNYLKMDAVSIACELLKMAGDQANVARSSLRTSFRNFTHLVELRGQSSKTAATQTKLTANFFQNHALGMMASFSDVIENPQQPSTEKKRCLKGIEQMVDLAKTSINFAIPQIRACLQSALCSEPLRDLAFSAWSTLLGVLEAQGDIEALIEPTFANIVQNWSAFHAKTQQVAYDTVARLLKDHGPLVQDTVLSIPSLKSIPLMSKFESQLSRLRNELGEMPHLQAFSKRCQDENSSVVAQALSELLPFLEDNQYWIHESAVSDQPNIVIAELTRALLDTCIRFHDDSAEISNLCAQCLGIIGCLDPNRIETIREKHEMLVLSNFTQANEAIDFVTFLLERVLVKAFFSVSNPRAQGFLAFVMQELLRFCGFSKETTQRPNPQSSQSDDTYIRWTRMPETVRSTLRPFLSSRYVLKANTSHEAPLRSYPIFANDTSHGSWLRDFVFDLLQRSVGENARMIFSVVSRVIRGYDVSIAGFLLPFAAANVVIGGAEKGVEHVSRELLAVLEHQQAPNTTSKGDSHRLCSENVFQILDYFSRWLQAKRRIMLATRYPRETSAQEQKNDTAQVQRVERVLSAIPAPVISQRAVECGSFARALFHWEDHMRQHRQSNEEHVVSESEALYQQLQDIYANIDEPDGLDGISAHLHLLTPEQKALEHRRAGRWAAAQSWYEFELRTQPEDIQLQVNLMTCLREAGLFNVVLEHAKNASSTVTNNPKVLSLVAEAAWRTESWRDLEKFIKQSTAQPTADFNFGLGSAFLALRRQDESTFSMIVESLRSSIVTGFSASTTASLQACHGQLLKLHALYEVEALGTSHEDSAKSLRQLQKRMIPRLDVLGSYVPDKQYLLGIRRAAMAMSKVPFSNSDLSSSWMTTAKLARKNGALRIAYDAVTIAMQKGDTAAKIEEARLLWKEGESRRAIHSLESAIETNAFENGVDTSVADSTTAMSMASIGTNSKAAERGQNLLVAKAHLLLARWLDQAGQTQSKIVNEKYQFAAKSYSKWEKGFYCLGRYYNKLLESEKALPAVKQTHKYLGGETAKLVVENYLRSLMFGCKYLFETLPKLLTLWLDFGVESSQAIHKDVPADVKTKTLENRPRMLDTMNKQIKKYVERIPPYIFYTAIAQLISRLSHPNQKVYEVLALMITKVVAAHPQQALWPLLAVAKSSVQERGSRGAVLINKLRENKSKVIRHEGQSVDMRSLVSQGQRISEQLLQACEVSLDGRTSTVSLSSDLKFSARVAPCSLVIPLEQTLTASLPTIHDHLHIKSHASFPESREAVTISSFSDEVLVLNSLQKPRKLTVRGSNGKKYGLLCKPHDDLRKDQRLMEFNTMINRALKKDAESSKRGLYIKTYAVTPLNESCGLIEWVEGLKPIRDILLGIYKSKGIVVDYALLRELLNEACSTPEGHRIFSDQILNMYKPVLHEWFADVFPEPESWFAARLRYTRSCAVTSIVGHALGLGDRHGENILLVESTGEVFHVDFNCLFDKGLTFEKPELVPFRLTHNMVDAFGAYGVEGPFRRSAECTMRVMRNYEEALLTILETFVYDPTADFMGTRKRIVKGVPHTAEQVLESVESKVRGLMRGESVPLSIEGHTHALINQATDPANLCAMYIGWCAFF